MADFDAPLWDLRGVSKAVPGVQALDRVSLTIDEGEIHALVGENGSGKSTLVKCLAGVHEPESGELRHRGTAVRLANPQEARRHGVATFYQEFSLVRSLSVAENICLGQLPARGPVVSWPEMRRIARDALAELGISLDPTAPVEGLSIAEQQFVEIAKALSQQTSLLILDEPTAALGPGEVERLHGVIERLARQGRAVLYINHRLDEVLEAADRVSVLRDGRLVASVEAARTSSQEIARHMVGQDFEEQFPERNPPSETPRLEVVNLWTETGVKGVSLSITSGEIVGLGGVSGAGRTELARALYGADQRTAGSVRIDGLEVPLRSPAEAIATGVAFVPEDRQADGLFFNFAGPQNITVVDLARLLLGPFLRLGAERDAGENLVTRLRIAGNAMTQSVRYLSGGNQQKVVLGRWLFTETKILLLDEPTQGIDVSAKQEVYQLLGDLTAKGVAVLFISSDFPELLEVSDRVIVLRHGRAVHEAARGELTEAELIELAGGGVMAS